MDTPGPELIDQLFEQVRARGFKVEIERTKHGYIVVVSNAIAEQRFGGPDLYDLALQVAFRFGEAARTRKQPRGRR